MEPQLGGAVDLALEPTDLPEGYEVSDEGAPDGTGPFLDAWSRVMITSVPNLIPSITSIAYVFTSNEAAHAFLATDRTRPSTQVLIEPSEGEEAYVLTLVDDVEGERVERVGVISREGARVSYVWLSAPAGTVHETNVAAIGVIAGRKLRGERPLGDLTGQSQ